MDNKKIFLVNLSKGRLGDINANLLGMIFVMKFQQAAMSRQDIPEHERKDFCLYVDEFQNFATDSFESILSEARKYRLNLIVANQFMTQLTDKIREALLGNVGTIMCGRIGVTDADLMVKAFTPVFTAEDLTKTANHQAICKVMIFGMPSSPFTISLPPPMGDASEDLMNSLKIYTASKYGRTRAEVEAEIRERQTKKEEKKEEPAAVSDGDITEDIKKETSDGKVGQKPEEKKDDFLADWAKKKKEIEAKKEKPKGNDDEIDSMIALLSGDGESKETENKQAEKKPTEIEPKMATKNQDKMIKEGKAASASTTGVHPANGEKVKVDLNSSSQEGVIKLR